MSSPLIDYKPLKMEHEIRLLKLQPGSESEHVQCFLVHANLDENPKYEALSYVWGPENVPWSIEIDGKVCDVRENLWLALSNLRMKDKVRTLWVDALCINQKDHLERSKQVSQMGAIYRRAETVCAWLGPEDTNSSLAFTYILDKYVVLKQGKLVKPHSATSLVKELGTFYNRDYWHRLWIIQEVMLAGNIWFYCGKNMLLVYDWEKSNKLSTYSYQKYLDSNLNPELEDAFYVELEGLLNCSAWRLLRQRLARRPHFENTAKPLFELVQIYWDANCCEPKDKVFGLRSLSLDCCQSAVHVDYTKISYNICTQILQHHFSHHFEEKQIPSIVGRVQRLHLVTHAFLPPSIQDNISIPNGRTIPPGTSELSTTENEARIKIEILCNIRGIISYVSPTLKDLSTERMLVSEGPLMTSNLRKQLDHTRKLCGPGKAWKSSITPSIDLVEEIESSISHTAPRERSYLKGTSSSKMKSSDSPSRKAVKTTTVKKLHEQSSSPSRPFFNQISQLLRIASKAVSNHPSQKDCVLFLEPNGMIGFAPPATQVGDIVAQFKDSDIVAILRKVDTGYKIVGRAVEFLTPSTRELQSFRCVASENKPGFDVPSSPVNFTVDILNIQSLAKMSLYQKNSENDEIVMVP